jgi:hypothetical protein
MKFSYLLLFLQSFLVCTTKVCNSFFILYVHSKISVQYIIDCNFLKSSPEVKNDILTVWTLDSDRHPLRPRQRQTAKTVWMWISCKCALPMSDSFQSSHLYKVYTMSFPMSESELIILQVI